MKNTILLLIIAFSFITCSKKNDHACMNVSPASEANEIAAFCDSKSIDYTVDSNGIYYQIIDQGSGIAPTLNSIIKVTYTTQTLDGNVVEDNTVNAITKPLTDFIEGWRIALPYIQKGGHIKMVIPSSLAYGCTGISNVIAPDSPLYYDVVLMDVQ